MRRRNGKRPVPRTSGGMAVSMEMILLIGIQATGKSTFFRDRFADTHVRINLDMLKTRHREALLLRTCLEIKQPFVVDNTNVSTDERDRYIEPASKAGFRVIGYYFSSTIQGALSRNAARADARRIPERGVRGTHARLELPRGTEGFDTLYHVTLLEDGGFDVSEWRDEV